MIFSGQRNNTIEDVCPFTSVIKGKISKARPLGIKREFLQDINFDGFSPAKLYQQRISRLQVVMKKVTIFQINLSCQSSYSTRKLVGLFFPRFPKRK